MSWAASMLHSCLPCCKMLSGSSPRARCTLPLTCNTAQLAAGGMGRERTSNFPLDLTKPMLLPCTGHGCVLPSICGWRWRRRACAVVRLQGRLLHGGSCDKDADFCIAAACAAHSLQHTIQAAGHSTCSGKDICLDGVGSFMVLDEHTTLIYEPPAFLHPLSDGRCAVQAIQQAAPHVKVRRTSLLTHRFE